jgi:hypothetical protein
MCTVTFIPRRTGYCLAMNRDEKRARPKGLPPTRKSVNGRQVLCPSELGGGTWIALNDNGAVLALVNWYSVNRRVNGYSISRGEVVGAAGAASAESVVERALAKLCLDRINPFRLIGVFPATRSITEWRWDLKRLTRKQHRWRPQQWISSGLDEPSAQRIRARTFRAAWRQKSHGSLSWVRRLHCSHVPHKGPFSTCMHRDEAMTVSYTELAVRGHRARMRHVLGPPCRGTRVFDHSLSLVP